METMQGKNDMQQRSGPEASVQDRVLMIRDGTHQQYLDDMHKEFASGAVPKLTVDEVLEWQGPVHYIRLF